MVKATKDKRPISKHSRAARRASSPSLNIDKSLKNIPLPFQSSRYGPLRPTSAGVSKKSKHRQVTRQQRLRKEREISRAEGNIEKLAVKVQKSGQSGNKIKERRKDWEDLNRQKSAKANKSTSLVDQSKDTVVDSVVRSPEEFNEVEKGVSHDGITMTIPIISVSNPAPQSAAITDEEDVIL